MHLCFDFICLYFSYIIYYSYSFSFILFSYFLPVFFLNFAFPHYDLSLNFSLCISILCSLSFTVCQGEINVDKDKGKLIWINSFLPLFYLFFK